MNPELEIPELDIDQPEADEPQIGMAVGEAIGKSAEIISDSPLRASQIGAALNNQGVQVALTAPQSDMGAMFHKSAVPEQPQVHAVAHNRPQPAMVMTRKA